MWICTSARSIERCSRIRPATLSATPIRISVAGTTRSEIALIVSAKRTPASWSREPVELVDEDRDRLVAAHALQHRPHGVGRDRLLAESARPGLERLLVRLRESDLPAARPEPDLGERLAPDAREVVADVAGGTRRQRVRALEQLSRDCRERRLPHATLAVDDRVLARLRDDREDLADLIGAAGEEAATVDRRCRTEALADALHPIEQLLLAHLLARRRHTHDSA